MTPTEQAKALVDAAIVEVVLPQCYDLLNQLLVEAEAGEIQKPTVVAVRKLLPAQYSKSFSAGKK